MRRGSQKASSNIPILILAGAILAAGASFLFSSRGHPSGADSSSSTGGFPINDFLTNAQSLRGNRYSLEGSVVKTLEYVPESGRMIAVDVSGNPLPLLIPKRLESLNVERGQRYRFGVTIDQRGVPTVDSAKKF
jgi:hypothetical protein